MYRIRNQTTLGYISKLGPWIVEDCCANEAMTFPTERAAIEAAEAAELMPFGWLLECDSHEALPEPTPKVKHLKGVN